RELWWLNLTWDELSERSFKRFFLTATTPLSAFFVSRDSIFRGKSEAHLWYNTTPQGLGFKESHASHRALFVDSSDKLRIARKPPGKNQASDDREARGANPPGGRGRGTSCLSAGDFLRALFLRGAVDSLVRL